MLSCFAPFTAEEGWERLGHEPSVASAGWPQADPTLLVEDTVTCILQVDGKLRDRVDVPARLIGRRPHRDRPGLRTGTDRACGGDGRPGHRAGAEAGQRRHDLITA